MHLFFFLKGLHFCKSSELVFDPFSTHNFLKNHWLDCLEWYLIAFLAPRVTRPLKMPIEDLKLLLGYSLFILVCKCYDIDLYQL